MNKINRSAATYTAEMMRRYIALNPNAADPKLTVLINENSKNVADILEDNKQLEEELLKESFGDDDHLV